jgi:hypothetical protein
MKKTNRILKIYGSLGKGLCTTAGILAGFALGGPLVMVPGFIVGILGGHFLEKAMLGTLKA